uniref:Glutaredoxin domain-containing protein n=1 Tax=Chenopodium quinoa TaxID=63459 RepID=A0A803LJX9_CHEQI
MKGMKGKLMKKLKTVKQIGYLNPDRILQVIDVETLMKDIEEERKVEIGTKHDFEEKENVHPSISKDPVCELGVLSSCCKESKKQSDFDTSNCEELKKQSDSQMEILSSNCEVLKKQSNSEIVLLSSNCEELKKQSDSEMEILSSNCEELKKQSDSEMEILSSCSKELKRDSDSEFEVSCFRRPDMDSGTLFDPKLLAAFEEAVKEHIRSKESAQLENTSKNHKYPFFQPEDQADPLIEFDEETNPLEEFEEKCPPGGEDSVIFYTTSLRGIRKTFEDCQCIRFLLESFGLIYYERDVSIHSEFRDELWRIMGEKSLPPRLFIRGRYIGGAEQVLTLNEQGKLRPLFRDIPINFSEGPCNVCCGLRFILCYNCNGSRKIFEHNDQEEEEGGLWSKCLQCNENGLVVCPLC